MLTELGFDMSEPTVVYIDSTSAQDLASDEKYRKRSRHIDIKNHWIREAIKAGHIRLDHVDTDFNVADQFTKNLSVDKYHYFRNWLVRIDSSEL